MQMLHSEITPQQQKQHRREAKTKTKETTPWKEKHSTRSNQEQLFKKEWSVWVQAAWIGFKVIPVPSTHENTAISVSLLLGSQLPTGTLC